MEISCSVYHVLVRAPTLSADRLLLSCLGNSLKRCLVGIFTTQRFVALVCDIRHDLKQNHDLLIFDRLIMLGTDIITQNVGEI